MLQQQYQLRRFETRNDRLRFAAGFSNTELAGASAHASVSDMYLHSVPVCTGKALIRCVLSAHEPQKLSQPLEASVGVIPSTSLPPVIPENISQNYYRLRAYHLKQVPISVQFEQWIICPCCSANLVDRHRHVTYSRRCHAEINGLPSTSAALAMASYSLTSSGRIKPPVLYAAPKVTAIPMPTFCSHGTGDPCFHAVSTTKEVCFGRFQFLQSHLPAHLTSNASSSNPLPFRADTFRRLPIL